MKKLNNFCAVFVFLLLAVSSVFTSCADLYDETELYKNELCIASTGSDTDGDGSGIKPYLTLGKALEHITNAGLGSSAEWTVYVLDEVECHEEISSTTFTGSKLTLQGINGSCALNGNQSGSVQSRSVLKITAPGTFEINKLKITRGSGTNVSGYKKGGGIYLDNTNATVIIASDSSITLNTAESGGGVYINSGSFKLYGTVSGNTASTTNSTSNGGGIYLSDNCSLDVYGSITSNTVSSSSSDALGGGIFINSSSSNSGSLNLYGSIASNTASASLGHAYGGGLYINNNSVVTVNCSVTSNIAADGGGIFIESATLNLCSSISSNTATNQGGGIYINGNGSSLNLIDNYYIVNNTAQTSLNQKGHGIYRSSSSVSVNGDRTNIIDECFPNI